MAIRKIEMRPPGTGDYADILYPKTSADIVMTDTDTTVQSELTSLSSGKANAIHTHAKADIIDFPSLGTAASKNTGTTSGTIPILDTNGKLNAGVLPAIAISETFVVSSQTAMLALTAQIGDIAVRTDLNKSFILKTDGASVLANWQELLTPTDVVTSVAGKTGAVTLAAGDVGLGNVTNESKTTMFASPNFTGAPTVPTATSGTNTQQIATTAFVQDATSGKANANNVLTLDNITAFTPDADYEPATKKYVDDKTTNMVTTSGTQTLTNKTLTSPKINETVALTAKATELNILSSATITTTELNYLQGVTSAIQTQLGAKAPLASPALAGTPTAPTAEKTINNTQIATTAFVKNQGYLTGITKAQVESVLTGTITTHSHGAAAPASHASTHVTGSTDVISNAVANGNSGLMSGVDKDKLDKIANGANNYVHPTGDGNLHVPVTGTTNNKKALVAGSSAGSIAWTSLTKSHISDFPTKVSAFTNDTGYITKTVTIGTTQPTDGTMWYKVI